MLRSQLRCGEDAIDRRCEFRGGEAQVPDMDRRTTTESYSVLLNSSVLSCRAQNLFLVSIRLTRVSSQLLSQVEAEARQSESNVMFKFGNP